MHALDPLQRLVHVGAAPGLFLHVQCAESPQPPLLIAQASLLMPLSAELASVPALPAVLPAAAASLPT